MPESQAAFPAAPPLFFFEEEDGFGEFEFASPPAPPLFPTPSPSPKQHEDDDEWGEFVATPQSASRPSEAPPPLLDPLPEAAAAPPPGRKIWDWEKPRGALPLSIFGDEEAEEPPVPLPALAPSAAACSPGPTKDRIGSHPAWDLKGLIADLYGQAGSGGGPGDGGGGDLDDDDDSWEFKDAFSTENGVQKKETGSESFSGLEKAAGRSDSGIQETRTMWEDSICDIPISYYHNGKEDPGGQVLDENVLACEPSSLRNESTSVDVFSDVVHSEIISSLYNMSEYEQAVYPSQNSPDIGQKSHQSDPNSLIVNKDPDTDEFGWEFQITSERTLSTHNFVLEEDKIISTDSTQNITTNAQDSPQNITTNAQDSPQNITTNARDSPEPGPNSVAANACNDSDEIDWEFQMASEETVANQNSAFKEDQPLSMELTQNNLLDMYFRLKEVSLFLVAHHLGDLQKAHEVAALSGEQDKAMKLNEEIQGARKKLQEEAVISDVCIEKYPSKRLYVSQLFEIIREPYFRPFEQEYGLSEAISSAEETLSAAISLFEHATLMLRILALASLEGQRAYILTWSKMAQACAQELEHGAKIWEESLHANVCEQVLSQGKCYFIALGEIYHVAEILRASLKLYRPWMLASKLDSNDILACLEKCTKAWMTSGLRKALHSIINANSTDLGYASTVKVLLETIEITRGLDNLVLQSHLSGHKEIGCRLSLLPMGVLQDIKPVVWNGEHYFLKLANLWANCISCDPPKLPQICVRYSYTSS